MRVFAQIVGLVLVLLLLGARTASMVGWEDMRFPFGRERQGATLKPDYDTTNLGLLFPQNDPTEIVYITDQFSHSVKLGHEVRPHLHYFQDEPDHPIFKMDWRVYKNGATPGGFNTITAAAWRHTYTAGVILQKVTFPAWDLSAIDTMSAFFDIKFYRDDNVVGGDVLVKGLDLHILTDSIGSADEFSKL